MTDSPEVWAFAEISGGLAPLRAPSPGEELRAKLPVSALVSSIVSSPRASIPAAEAVEPAQPNRPLPSRSSAAPAPRKWLVVRFVIGFLILLAVGYGVYRFVNSLGKESTDNAQINGQLDPAIPRVAGTRA